MANKNFSFFPKERLSRAVLADDLTKPKERQKSEIESVDFASDLNEGISDSDGFSFSETTMFGEAFGAGNLDEDLDQLIDQQNEQKEEVGAQLEGSNIPNESHSFDINFDLQTETITEVWDNLRRGGWSIAYEKLIIKAEGNEELRMVYDHLKWKASRSSEEMQLFKRLDEFFNEHHSLRTEFLDSIPYSEKQKERFGKILQYFIYKWTGATDGKLPDWLIFAAIIAGPEIKVGTTLWRISKEMPKMDLDMAELKKILGKN
jgi:hypothetical protein